MALNPATLAVAMREAVQDLAPNDYETPALYSAAIYEALAEAIVTHITTNAVVTVASVSGVTVGAGTSGPGVGTIS